MPEVKAMVVYPYDGEKEEQLHQENTPKKFDVPVQKGEGVDNILNIIRMVIRLSRINAFNEEFNIRGKDNNFIPNTNLAKLLSLTQHKVRNQKGVPELIQLLYEAKIKPKLIQNEFIKARLNELYGSPTEDSHNIESDNEDNSNNGNSSSNQPMDIVENANNENEMNENEEENDDEINENPNNSSNIPRMPKLKPIPPLPNNDESTPMPKLSRVDKTVPVKRKLDIVQSEEIPTKTALRKYKFGSKRLRQADKDLTPTVNWETNLDQPSDKNNSSPSNWDSVESSSDGTSRKRLRENIETPNWDNLENDAPLPPDDKDEEEL